MPKNSLSILPEKELPVSANEDIEIRGGSMVTSFADLNRMVHEPARLAIMTVLSSCARADFTFLQTATGLSKGNLSVQLSRLEEAELISINKTIEKKRTLTTVALTREGHSELQKYWRQMERIRSHTVDSGVEKSQQSNVSRQTKAKMGKVNRSKNIFATEGPA